jgi:acetolactate synthase-1/2/3 large subunit
VQIDGHGGDFALAALAGFGVRELFTLSGGHVFPIYDAARRAGIRIIDVRHEQSAVFAAEAVAKLQRRPGVAVLTAGPGVTNGISALTSAWIGGSPVVVLAGRAPQFRWGSGSLQEIDHLPLVGPVTKHAETIFETGEIAARVQAAAGIAITPHRGPVFVDIPLEVIYSTDSVEVGAPEQVGAVEPDFDEVALAARLLAAAQRPVIVAGSDVYAGGAVAELREAAEALRIPVFTNGMGSSNA